MSVLVLVLNYNGGSGLDACLASLQASSYPSMRLVVLDNGSNDGSLEYAKNRRVEIREYHENLGYCAAYNRAFHEYEGEADFFLLSNADLLVPPPTIERLVGVAQTDDSIGFVGPVQQHADTREIRSAGIAWRCGRMPVHVNRPGDPIDAVEGAFVLVRKRIIDRVGELDEALFLNLEDVEWQTRAKRAGFQVHLARDAAILHRRPGRERVATGAYYQARNALYVTTKYCPSSAAIGLERRLRWEGRIGSFLRRPRGPEILRGIEDFHAGRMGARGQAPRRESG